MDIKIQQENNSSDNISKGLTSQEGFGLENVRPSSSFLISNIFLAVLILFGNIFVCLVFRVDRRIRKHTNNLVISLVICDILVAVIYIPVYLYDSSTLQRNHVQYVVSFIWIASILNHSALAFDRYQGVMRPLHYEKIMTPKTVKILLTIVWLIPSINTIVPMPLMITSALSDNDKRIFVKYFISCNLLIILTGVVLIFSVYIAILYVSKKHANYDHKLLGHLYPVSLLNDETESSSPCFIARLKLRLMRKNFKADLKLAKLFFTVVATHLICWLPMIYVNVCEQLIFPGQLNMLITLAPIELIYAMYYAFISISVLNPLIFALFRKEFRSGCRKLFGMSRQEARILNDPTRKPRPTLVRDESLPPHGYKESKELVMMITCL